MCLMEAVSPGVEGDDMVEGISQKQYMGVQRIPSERAQYVMGSLRKQPDNLSKQW